MSNFVLLVTVGMLLLKTEIALGDPLDEFARNFPSPKKGSFQCVVETILKKKSFYSKQDNIKTIYHDNNKIKVFSKDIREHLVRGKPEQSYYCFEQIHTPDLYFHVSFSPNLKFESAQTLMDSNHGKQYSIPYLGIYDYSFRAITWGYDGIPIYDLMRLDGYNIKETTLDGKYTHLITADNDWGKFELWVDPAQGYMPLRFIIEKEADHRINNTEKLSEYYRTDEYWMVWRREEFETKQVTKLNHQYYLSDYIWKYSSKSNRGESSEGAERIRISNMQLVNEWKEDPFKVTIKIPNGARIQADDQTHIRYEWQNGKVVKSIDQPKVELLARTKFIDQPNSGYWRWILLSLAIFSVVYLYFKILR